MDVQELPNLATTFRARDFSAWSLSPVIQALPSVFCNVLSMPVVSGQRSLTAPSVFSYQESSAVQCQGCTYRLESANVKDLEQGTT